MLLLSSTSKPSAFASCSSASGYSASCSSFQPSAGSASQWLSQRPGFVFQLFRIFPFLTAWFPVRSFRFRLLSFPVCFLSRVPDSLPQLFLRCFRSPPPFTASFPGSVHASVRSASTQLSLSFRFAPVRLGSSLLSLCFFLPPLQHSASQWLPACPPLSALPLSFASRFGFPPSLRSPPSPFGSFGSLRSGLGTRFRRSSFHRNLVCLTAALHVACLPSRVQAFPLASFVSAFPQLRLHGLPLRFPPRPP